VNNCIGRRNYTSFITFLVAAVSLALVSVMTRSALTGILQSLALALVIVTAALHLFILTRRNHVNFRTALSSAPASAVVFSLGIIVIWPLLALMGFHVRVGHPSAVCALWLLIGWLSVVVAVAQYHHHRTGAIFCMTAWLNLLFIVLDWQVRNKFHATLVPGPTPPNPFSLGRWYRNVAYLLCRPAGYTWIEASAIKMEDQRQINPGAHVDWDEEENTTQKSPIS
jgi:hypothetical protein